MEQQDSNDFQILDGTEDTEVTAIDDMSAERLPEQKGLQKVPLDDSHEEVKSP